MKKPRLCHGKTNFDTFKEAERVAKRMSREDDAVLNPYHCKECNTYHIGERLGGKQKRPRGGETLDRNDLRAIIG